MLLEMKKNQQKKEGEKKMAVIDLALLVTLVITIGIAIKIYKD